MEGLWPHTSSIWIFFHSKFLVTYTCLSGFVSCNPVIHGQYITQFLICPKLNLWLSLCQLLNKAQSWSAVWAYTHKQNLIFAFFPLWLNAHLIDGQILWNLLQSVLSFRCSFLSFLLSFLLDPWHLSPAMFQPPFVRSSCCQSVPTLAQPPWCHNTPPKTHLSSGHLPLNISIVSFQEQSRNSLNKRPYMTCSQILLHCSLPQLQLQGSPATLNI